jgi:hypothetical protein
MINFEKFVTIAMHFSLSARAIASSPEPVSSPYWLWNGSSSLSSLNPFKSLLEWSQTINTSLFVDF